MLLLYACITVLEFAVGTGGLGSTFDELTLNKKVCDNLGVSL
jgi:hypothetical protein